MFKDNRQHCFKTTLCHLSLYLPFVICYSIKLHFDIFYSPGCFVLTSRAHNSSVRLHETSAYENKHDVHFSGYILPVSVHMSSKIPPSGKKSLISNVMLYIGFRHERLCTVSATLCYDVLPLHKHRPQVFISLHS